jgi:hypothetical protein
VSLGASLNLPCTIFDRNLYDGRDGTCSKVGKIKPPCKSSLGLSCGFTAI